MTLLEKKEKEKNAAIQLYNKKMINYANIKKKIKNNKEKLEVIRRKNEYMKLLICKLMIGKK